MAESVQEPSEIVIHDSLRCLGKVPKKILPNAEEFARLSKLVDIGIGKMEIEFGVQKKISQEEFEAAKQNYRDFVFCAYELLVSERKEGGFGWNKERVASALAGSGVEELVADITSIIWSNFEYSPTTFLLDSFSEHYKPRMDCDISVYVASQLLVMLGFSPEIAIVGIYRMPEFKIHENEDKKGGTFEVRRKDVEHAVLKVGGQYFETTTGDEGIADLVRYDEAEFKRQYFPRLGSTEFVAGAWDDLGRAGKNCLDSGDTERALRFFIDALGMNPTNAGLYGVIGEIYRDRGENEAAAETMLEGIEVYRQMEGFEAERCIKEDFLFFRMVVGARNLIGGIVESGHGTDGI